LGEKERKKERIKVKKYANVQIYEAGFEQNKSGIY